jgi:signal transduction histidine kinase
MKFSRIDHSFSTGAVTVQARKESRFSRRPHEVESCPRALVEEGPPARASQWRRAAFFVKLDRPMNVADGFRARLLVESSERTSTSLARIRVAAGAAFCLIAALLSLAGETDVGMNFWPLLAYVMVSWALFRRARHGGFWKRLDAYSPLIDVVFIYALQAEALAHREAAEFGAGFTLGLYALLVGLSALSMRRKVVAATAAVSALLLALLQLQAGIHFFGISASVVVLLLAGLGAASVVGELDSVVARLVVNEVRNEEMRRAQSEAETLTDLLVHDMKGPLTGLIGLSEVVASELSGPLQADVKRIEAQGRRLQEMVGDLLAIARLERGVLQSPPEAVDLSALVHSLVEAYGAPARQAGAQIGSAVEPGLSATLHREMVHRLYDNLVLNALDFVRPGGRIEVAAWQKDRELLLAVRNTGEPVPAEARARLFQKGGQSGVRRKQNLGLGLYLCRLVAVAHDGTIGLEEEPGWAASFIAHLPVEPRAIGKDLLATARTAE